MLNPGDRHLTDEELHVLAGREFQSGHSLGLEPAEDAAQHVLECPDCREKFDAHVKAIGRLSALKSPTAVESGRICPADEAWMNLAAGLCDEKDAQPMLDHAAVCDHCGPLLNTLINDFSDSTTPEELRTVAGSASNSPGWQSQLAMRLTSGHRGAKKPRQLPSMRRPFFALRWAAMAAGLLVAVAAVVWIFVPRPEVRVQQLIAEAYTEQRTIEMRIPGAAFAPVRVRRGGQSSRLDNPQALLDAEAIISKKLAERPTDPVWLESRARTELLEGNYNAAIESLQKALALQPKSGPLLADLASGFYERGTALDRPADLGHALDLLGKAIALSPREPAVLFNRAIVAERLFLYSQAAEDWREYLKLDPNSTWSEEARLRLKQVQEKLQNHTRERNLPLLQPPSLARALANQNDPTTLKSVDERIEEYYHAAILEWLPAAYPQQTSLRNETVGENRSALLKLSELSLTQHDDHWMSDLLSQTNSNRFPAALQLLSSAKRANDDGDFALALRIASTAKKEFSVAGNPAGEMRASLEKAYALRLTQEALRCVDAAQKLTDALSRRRYSWLSVQAKLELAICHDVTGSPERAVNDSQNAMKAAERSKYGASWLRALLVSSVLSSPSTLLNSKWASDMAGLNHFWNGSYPSMSGYNFYVDLDTLAEKSSQPYLEIAVLREASETLGPDPDLLLRAMLHSRIAAVSLRADMPDLSSAEYVQSDRLFQQAPQSGAAVSGQLEAQTWLARIETLHHDYRNAERRLSSLESSVSRVSNQYVVMNFYQALAEVRLGAGDLAGVSKPATASIALAEHELLALKSDDDRLLWNREATPSYKTLIESYLKRGDTSESLEVWEWYRGASLRGSPVRDLTKQIENSDARYRNLTFTTLSNPPPVPKLELTSQIREGLLSQTVLTYAILPEGVAAWEFDDRGINPHWIPIEESSLTDLVHQYVRLCSDPRSDAHALSLESRQLYDLLVAPFADRIAPDRTLVVEPDGILSSLPFAALLDRSGHYLADSTPIVISPGLYYSVVGRPYTRLDDSSNLLVVGSPALGPLSSPDLKPLADTRAEAELVAGKFHKAQVFLGAGATVTSVREALKKSDVFHFAGHAVSSPGNAALLFAPTADSDAGSGRLDAEQLRSWDLHHLRLVVLSACGTENTSAEDLPDPGSLVFVFLRAGVPYVIASRWSVDSASTTGLVSDFYTQLRRGDSVPQALRFAAANLRSLPGKNHPYYWAAFDSFGRI